MQNHTPNDNKIPYGYCHCGCGQRTKIAKYNDSYHGLIAGEPLRFINGHHGRRRPCTHRKCTKCGEKKQVSAEFFHRDKRAYDGFESQCKECANKKSRENHAKYYAANQEQLVKKSREWYHSNKQKAAERAKRYHHENKDAIAEKRKEYRENNKNKLAEYMKSWWQANPEKRKEHKSRRRWLKKNATGSHTADDIKAQHKRQKGRCYYCSCKVGKSYHVDHVIPLTRGGSNGPENIVIACQFCNISKKDKMPHEWKGTNRLL